MKKNIEQGQQSLSPPPRVVGALYLTRLGKISSNLSIFSACVGILALIAMLSSLFTLVFSVLLILITLGTIFAIVPDYWERCVKGSADAANSVIPIASNIAFGAGIATIVFSVVAIVTLLANRGERHPARIVFAFISLAAGVGVIAVSMVSGGGQ